MMTVRVARETRAAMDRGLVLKTLLPGGQLTVDVLSASAGVRPRRVRRAVETLHDWGMLRVARHGTAWEITSRGRGYAATSIGRASMDVPRMAVAG